MDIVDNIENIKKMDSIEKTQLYHAISVRYQEFYNEYYGNMQKAKKYYSLFVNNNLEIRYFEKMLFYCNKVFENINQFRHLENINNILVGTDDVVHTNDAYIVLAKAYEKLKRYEEAINICSIAIENNFENDRTKYGFKGRINRLKKINNN